MKYKFNGGGSMGTNFRLYLDNGTEIGHFYPNDKFDPEEHGWIDLDDKPQGEIPSEPFKLLEPQ